MTDEDETETGTISVATDTKKPVYRQPRGTRVRIRSTMFDGNVPGSYSKGKHSSDDYEPPWCFFRHTTTKWSGPSGRGVARRGYNAHKVTRLQLRRVGGSATIEEVNRDDTDDGLAPRLRSH